MTEQDRKADLGRIDRALELVEEVLSEPLTEGAPPPLLALSRETRLKAADRLVSLLERRAKLLGLDATPSEATGAGEDKPGSIASVERRLGLVAK